MSIKREENLKTEICEKKFSDLSLSSSSSSPSSLPKRRKINSSSFDSITTTTEFKSSPPQLPSSPSTTITSSSSTGRRPRLVWTKEEDEALFNAINSVLTGQWKEVCTKNPILKARGTSMVAQRFRTKIRYFVGGNAERTKQ